MAERILILPRSGSGKTSSLRNLDPKETLVIQPVKKRLPFPHKDWKKWNKDTQTGSIFQTNTFHNVQVVLKKMEEVGKKIIVIDDFTFLFSKKVMDDVDTKGFDKWNNLGAEFYQLMQTIDDMNEDIRIYILGHVETDNDGFIKMKTAGKLIDNLLNPEAQTNIVFGMKRTDDAAFFITNGGTMDPYKSPMGMFKDKEIPNDLKLVDETIKKFYDIK